MGNTFGHLFRITTFGESHGGGVGVVIDGCPPRLAITAEEIQAELDRRRPGQSKITTPRKESDRCEILSGVFEGQTLGTPISILVRNENTRPQDYSEMVTTYRPSHADATYDAKYGLRNYQGGGRSSARDTIGRVAAGAIAKKILRQVAGVEVISYVKRIQDIEGTIDPDAVNLEQVESNIVRCPDPAAAEQMIDRIEAIRDQGDSIGGVVECVARGVPMGLGSPVFDRTNRSGGTQGGISNGENIIIRVANKPTATIRKAQNTVTKTGEATVLEARGRHDPCVLPRAVPMVEAMVALVLCDHLLRHQGQCSLF